MRNPEEDRQDTLRPSRELLNDFRIALLGQVGAHTLKSQEACSQAKQQEYSRRRFGSRSKRTEYAPWKDLAGYRLQRKDERCLAIVVIVVVGEVRNSTFAAGQIVKVGGAN